MLPYNSTMRASIQAQTVGTLFNSLQHPPASYLGDRYQYRTADGSHHVTSLSSFCSETGLISRYRTFYILISARLNSHMRSQFVRLRSYMVSSQILACFLIVGIFITHLIDVRQPITGLFTSIVFLESKRSLSSRVERFSRVGRPRQQWQIRQDSSCRPHLFQ